MARKVNPNFDTGIAVTKAAGDGGVVVSIGTLGGLAGGLLVGAVRSRGLAPWPENLDTAAVTLTAAGFAGLAAFVRRAVRNIKKNRFLK